MNSNSSVVSSGIKIYACVCHLSLMADIVILELVRLRKEDCKLEASFSCRVKPCLNSNRRTKRKGGGKNKEKMQLCSSHS